MNTMMLPSMQTDKTLSIEGVAADAKAVGDALKATELNVKHKLYSLTTDQYSQATIRFPDDCTAVLYFVCAEALVCPQHYENRFLTFRCFGYITNLELKGLRNTAISIELYYL